MKKFLLGTVAFDRAGRAAPASAADLAARPYTKAPPMIAADLRLERFLHRCSTAAGASSRKCWDFATTAVAAARRRRRLPRCDRRHRRWSGRLPLAGRSWVFGLEAQGNWADFNGPTSACSLRPSPTTPSRCLRPVHRPDRLRLEQRAALRQGRRRGDRRTLSDLRHRRPTYWPPTRVNETRWGGVVGVGLEYGFAPNWSVARRIRPHVHAGQDLHLHQQRYRRGWTLFSTERIRQDVDLVTVRVNYRWGGPVVAKY